MGFSIKSITGNERDILKGIMRVLSDQGGCDGAVLVSFNGFTFDLHVMKQRALVNKLRIPELWSGEFNSFLRRFSASAVDLKDIYSNYQYNSLTAVSLVEFAALCDLPTKMGIGGDKVYEEYLAGNIQAISDYCDIDSLITFLGFIRHSACKGKSTARIKRVMKDVVSYLDEDDRPLVRQFNSEWDSANWIF